MLLLFNSHFENANGWLTIRNVGAGKFNGFTKEVSVLDGILWYEAELKEDNDNATEPVLQEIKVNQLTIEDRKDNKCVTLRYLIEKFVLDIC